MEKEKLYIGCSSFNTPSWRTLFYPEDLTKKDWFDFYSKQFKTYEFNGSFYKFPETENLLKWHDKTPDDFKFSVKIPKIITHIRKLNDCEKEISDFYSVVKNGFKTKLACVLWQFPPKFEFSEENLDFIINSVKPGFKNTVEFRNISWWRKDVRDEFRKNDITFCNVSYPSLPDEIVKTTSTGYVRMHGIPKLFHSEYTDKEIKKLYDEISGLDFDEIYVYFNNTATTAGIINALQFRENSGKHHH